MGSGSGGFAAVRDAIERYVDQDILPGASWAILRGNEVIDRQCVGFADREANVALRTDHIFRMFSSTKLVVTGAVMLLVEDGRIGLDDRVGEFLPALADLNVLRSDATSIADVEPARSPITIRQLLSHTAGLVYGLFDPGSVLFKAYNEARILTPRKPLTDMIDALAALPLAFHPGTAWEYSVATDVLGRVVEVVMGKPLDACLKERVFDPLGMVDTGFYVPPADHDRLVPVYRGADVFDPMKPGLWQLTEQPSGIFRQKFPRLSGGGGLVSTLSDTVALVQALLPGAQTLLRPETVQLMMTNQLAGDCTLKFPIFGPITGKGFAFAGALTLAPGPLDPANSTGEIQWGGIAGTHWWICPKANIAGVLMAQRQMSFWNPFFFEFKRLAYEAAA